MDYHANKKWLEKTKKLNEETLIQFREQAAKKQYGKELDKKKIMLDEPIRSLGFYDVKIKLHQKVVGTIKVHVSEGK